MLVIKKMVTAMRRYPLLMTVGILTILITPHFFGDSNIHFSDWQKAFFVPNFGISQQVALGQEKEEDCWLPSGDRCPDEPRIGKGSDSRQLRSRGTTSEIPYVISPRFTQIKTSTPTLRWNDTQANSYEISICSKKNPPCLINEIVDRKELNITKKFGVSIASLKYPQRWNPLEKGITYRLKIRDLEKQKSSTDEKILTEDYPGAERGMSENGIIFRIISDNAFKKAVIDKSQNLGGITDNFLKMRLYSDAINTLEDMSTNLDNVYELDFIHTELGALYARSGLNLLAKGAYESAKESINASQGKDYQKRLEKIQDILKQLSKID
jgi:hypothetical protein